MTYVFLRIARGNHNAFTFKVTEKFCFGGHHFLRAAVAISNFGFGSCATQDRDKSLKKEKLYTKGRRNY